MNIERSRSEKTGLFSHWLNTKTSNSELEYFVLHADFSDTVSKVIKNEEKKKINKKYATAKVRTHA